LKLLSHEQINELDVDNARSTVHTYAGLIKSLADQYVSLEIKYKKLAIENKINPSELFIIQEQLATMKRALFGKSSEKSHMGGTQIELQTNEKKKREIFGRKAQPELAVIEQIHELAIGDQKCDVCSSEMQEFKNQYEESEEIDVVPAQYIKRLHKRKKYRCKNGCQIKTAAGPIKLKEGARYSVEFAVEVGINKYEHHLPLERQVRMMKQSGLNTDSQTLYKQADTVMWYLKKPLYEKICEKIRAENVVCADESPWGNLGANAKKRFYLWGLESKQAVYFKIADTRSGKVGAELIDDLSGVLMCDGYAGYNQLKSDKLQLANCFAHVRRKFKESEFSYPVESKEILDLIGLLYKIEDELKGKNLAEIKTKRSIDSKQIVATLYDRLWKLNQHLPRSSIGKAATYTLKLWRGLTVFLENPEVPLDNNAMERTIRGPVIGRKNHYGSKNLKTAEMAAIWYTIIETCKMNNVDSRKYIKEALSNILNKKPIKMPWEMS
jgi:transposase